jgi:RecA-family ATPase
LEEWCEAVDEADSPEWLINHFIPSDAIILVSGPAKRAHKTWFAYNCVRVLAAGKQSNWLEPAANIQDVGANSLILAQEGGRNATRRRWEWLAKADGWEVPDKRVLFAHRFPILLDDEAWLKRIRETIAANDVKLVIIDPLQKVFRGNESSPTDASAVMQTLDKIRNAGNGTSIMFVHHIRKPSGEASDIDEDVRGSTVFPGAYDVHIAFRPLENDVMLITVRCRDEEEKTFVGWWEIDGTKGTAKFMLEGTKNDT